MDAVLTGRSQDKQSRSPKLYHRLKFDEVNRMNAFRKHFGNLWIHVQISWQSMLQHMSGVILNIKKKIFPLMGLMQVLKPHINKQEDFAVWVLWLFPCDFSWWPWASVRHRRKNRRWISRIVSTSFHAWGLKQNYQLPRRLCNPPREAIEKQISPSTKTNDFSWNCTPWTPKKRHAIHLGGMSAMLLLWETFHVIG